jgi:hypothetical protein
MHSHGRSFKEALSLTSRERAVSRSKGGEKAFSAWIWRCQEQAGGILSGVVCYIFAYIIEILQRLVGCTILTI